MAHLAVVRKGWVAENLARFILSKFSFVAHPATVADDVGSDFFCTLFEPRKGRSRTQLWPQSSFAIQVKANAARFGIKGRLEYIDQLEMPYFVGVASLKRMTLTIYSGEYMPIFLSEGFRGIATPVLAVPCSQTGASLETYRERSRGGGCLLKLPQIVEVGASANGEELTAKVKHLRQACSRAYTHIVSKSNGEYLFKEVRDNMASALVLAGRTSVRQYRENLQDRLGEAFQNLKWTYENAQKEFCEAEFTAYETLLSRLKELEQAIGPVPDYVLTYYRGLKDLIDRNG
jgi:hypothetical protein